MTLKVHLPVNYSRLPGHELHATRGSGNLCLFHNNVNTLNISQWKTHRSSLNYSRAKRVLIFLQRLHIEEYMCSLGITWADGTCL